jgi:hypothetical protein
LHRIYPLLLVVILLIHDYGRSFLLLMSSSISFFSGKLRL